MWQTVKLQATVLGTDRQSVGRPAANFCSVGVHLPVALAKRWLLVARRKYVTDKTRRVEYLGAKLNRDGAPAWVHPQHPIVSIPHNRNHSVRPDCAEVNATANAV